MAPIAPVADRSIGRSQIAEEWTIRQHDFAIGAGATLIPGAN